MEDKQETMTTKELSIYLQDHPETNTIRNWVYKNAIPYHKINKDKTGRLYFIKAEIDEWNENGRPISIQK